MGLALVVGLMFVGVTQAQEQPQPPTPDYALTVRPNGPPVPAFRYELVPTHDLTRNNAALLIHRALHILSDVRPAEKDATAVKEQLDAAREKPLADFPRDEARNYLKPFNNAFKEMEAAARCDHCDWGTEDRVAAEGIGFLLPDAQKMRELAFLLTIRARLHAAEAKIDLALRDVQTGFALARAAAQGPTLIQFLVGNAIAAQMIRELEVVLTLPGCPNLYWSLTALPRPLISLKKGIEGELRSMEGTIPLPKDVDKGPMTPEDALAALDRLWAGIQKMADEPGKLGVAESRLGLATFITMQLPSARKALLAAGKTEAELDAMPPAQVVMLDSLVRSRNLRDQYFVWFQAPYAEAMEGMRRSQARFQKLRQAGQPFDYLQTMLMMLLPAIEKVYGAEVRTERRVASLRAVEAVRLYAASHDGKLPAKLADIDDVPVPGDVTTGQPFRYEVNGNRFVINVAPPPDEKPNAGNSWKYVVTVTR